MEDVRPAWLRVHTGNPHWLRGPLDSLVEGWSAEAVQWSRWHRAPAPVAVRLGGALDEVIAEMVATPHSAVLVETSAGWSAMFRPLNDPHAAYAPAIADYVPCEVASFDVDLAAGPGVGFWWEAAPVTRTDVFRGQPKRGVRLWEDGGKWHFEQYGNPLWFEDLPRYRKSRRRDRFDLQTLTSYAEALGVPLEDLDTYTGRAVLLHPKVYPPPPARISNDGRTMEQQLEDAQLQLARIAQHESSAPPSVQLRPNPDDHVPPTAANGMSLEVWFTTTSRDRLILAWWGNPVGGEVEIGLDRGDGVYFDSGDVSVARFVVPEIADGIAHHAVVTFDVPTKVVTVYLDGETRGTTSTVDGPWDDVTDITTLTIFTPQRKAAYFAGNFMSLIYATALTAQQIRQRDVAGWSSEASEDSIDEWTRYRERDGIDYG